MQKGISNIFNNLKEIRIDSFDQWGVELGKKLALQIAPAVQGDDAALEAQDSSTRQLITRYRGLRK